jgi:uncharacterized coiled-coil protein SlyX
MTKNKSILAGSAALAALAISAPAQSAQVFATDLIVQGSACIGFDCSTSESFGSDTLRLKENNLRIHFDDTSNSASFPQNDWRITANDSTNGGAEYLAIQDATAGTTPFRVDAGAGNNAVYVESGGFVGFGNTNPVLDLHVTQGNTPGLRLEQDGSSGFQSQSWDLAGNETNFFIRDVTNGSALPFKIRPGADDNALVIDNDNNIGLGILNATSQLHLTRSDGTSGILIDENSGTKAKRDMIYLQNNGNPQIILENTANSNTWVWGAGNAFVVEHRTSGLRVMEMGSNGDLEIPGTLTTGGGTCGGGCDAVFSAAYALPSIEEHSAAMWSNGYLPNVGPTIEGEPVNVSETMGRMLNELETAHVYIDQLNGELTAERAETEAQQAQIAALQERLARIEATLEN